MRIAAAVVQCLLSCCSIHGYVLLLPVVGTLGPVHRLGRASNPVLFVPVTSTSIFATQPDKESSSIDETRGKGTQGEWADWENDAHVDDDYSSTDDDDDGFTYTGTGLLDMMKYASAAVPPYQTTIPSSGLQTQLLAANSSGAVEGDVFSGSDSSTINTTTTAVLTAIRDPDYWKGWSEEAPYFDEYDVQDDEGNWGRADESSSGGDPALPVFGRGSSDLWTRNAAPSRMSTDEPQRTSIIASSSVGPTNASKQLNPAIDSSDDNDDDVATTTILSRLQQLELRLDARLDAISSALQTATAIGTTSAAASADPHPTSALRLQLPPPAVVVPYMVLFATIQALVNGFFQRR